MKGLILSLLPAAVYSAAIAQDGPSKATNSPFDALTDLLKSPGGMAAVQAALPRAKLANTKVLEAKIRPGAKKTISRYGPYILAGKDQPKDQKLTKSMDPNGQANVDIIDAGLCKNCTVLTALTGLVAADGSPIGPAQGVYSHHIISRDLSKAANLPLEKCAPGQKSPSNGRMGSEFLAQGDDGLMGAVYFTSADGTFNSGYHLKDNAVVMNQVDLVNYNKETKEVYVTYEIEYVDGLVGADASSSLVSVTGCKLLDGGSHAEGGAKPKTGIALDKSGPAETLSPKYPFTQDGKIVAAGAHMHDGGVGMMLYINDKEVCNAQAVYGKGGANNEETILQQTKCPVGIPFKKGDTLQLKSIYDLKKHPLRNGGGENTMGMTDVMGMFFMTFSTD